MTIKNFAELDCCVNNQLKLQDTLKYPKPFTQMEEKFPTIESLQFQKINLHLKHNCIFSMKSKVQSVNNPLK